MCTVEALFDLEKTLARDYLAGFRYPWEALAGIGALICSIGERLDSTQIDNNRHDSPVFAGYRRIAPQVWVHETAKVAASASVTGPCIIGPEAEVRHCAYIRGNALVGAGCVVGNSVELKNVILFDGVQVPHFNYVGDSILGYKAHMGAGAVTSNVRSDKASVVIHAGEDIPTGRKKVGAFLGDNAEIGCNSVLNPGTVVGRGASVYPTSCVRGVVPAGHIYKNDGTVIRRIG